MVNDVPSGVKKPGNADESVRMESSVRDVCRNGRVRELPGTQTSAEICGTSARNHDRIEFMAMWLTDERGQRNKDESNQYGCYEFYDADGSDCAQSHCAFSVIVPVEST